MLSDTAIRNMKPVAAPQKKADGGGLFILVQPAPGGAKLWRLSYRFGGKQKTLSGGAYPATGLADARRWRDQCKALLAAGEDPGAARKAAKIEAAASTTTFEILARQWLAMMMPHWENNYGPKVFARFENDVFPEIGGEEIASIDGPRLLTVLRKVEDRGSIETAHRLRAHIGKVFRFAISEGKATRDPSRDIIDAQKRPMPKRHRARFRADELPTFFHRLSLDPGTEMTHLALRWTLLTWVRSGETRAAEWSEIADDVWRIPAARMKMGFEHIVPLPAQAVALLPRIRELAAGSRWLFPVPFTKRGYISEHRMLDCMYRMGYRGTATVHGFRGLASTWANEETRADESGDLVRRWDSDWIERQLAHVEQNEVRGAYNAAEWLGARRRMLAAWGAFLESQEAIGMLLG